MQSPFDGEISAYFKTKAPDKVGQTIDGVIKSVTPAVVYCHFEGRKDLIAETALQGYSIFADLMEHAFRDGQPSSITAFEATGRARLNFLQVHPGHYISMFKSDISANRTTQLYHASQRAHNIMDRASQELRHYMHLDLRPVASIFSVHIQAMSHSVVGLFACDSACAQSPFEPKALIETGIGLYLRGVGVLSPYG
jgi:AcrR family transcriptional regulator